MIDLKNLFYPKNIAIIGVSNHPLKGGGFLSALFNSKYPGSIYLINPKRSEMFGKKVLSSILKVPEDIDLAIIAVPAKKVPEILNQCSGKVKFAVVFTSGFSEVDDKGLEEEIIKIAKKGKIRLIGPNCLGVHCNESRIAFFPQQQAGGIGNIGYISQSGGHAGTFTILGVGKGLEFNKSVSIGNQCDLVIQDFIEYFGNDPNIKIIAAYVEDAKDGNNFCKKVKEVTKKKPVVIWKGGITEEGKKAAFSHTGALAIPNNLWNSVMKQIGVINVDSMEELGDTIMSALYLESYPKGLNVGIVVGGGGSSVEITDACARQGLHVPQLSPKTKENLSKLIPDVNTSVKNPVDLGGMGFMPDIFRKSVQFVHEDPNIDAIVTYQMTERFVWFNDRVRSLGVTSFDFGNDTAREYKRLKKIIKKPLICVIPRIVETDLNIEKIRINFYNKLSSLKIPIFPTVSRAAKVYYRLYQYYNYLQRYK
ncbi:MAG: CoA-binding protein [Promethearchaeota archaeon]